MKQPAAVSGASRESTTGKPPVLITECQICSLTGISRFVARRYLRKCGIPVEIQFNGKAVSAWPIARLPLLIRAAVADTANHLASGIGAMPGPFASETPEPQRRNARPRPDRKLMNLSDAPRRNSFLDGWQTIV